MGEPTWREITAEAIRRKAQALKDGRGDIELEALIVEVTREGWSPPEPVDPDLLAFREFASKAARSASLAESYRDGDMDSCASAYLFIAGARMAREQERERARKLAEFVEDQSRRLDGVGARAHDILAKYRGEA